LCGAVGGDAAPFRRMRNLLGESSPARRAHTVRCVALAGGADYFAADKVWLYVTLLTIGYMVSRGLTKAGSRDPYDDDAP
jgi:hypothetical protein